MDSKHSVTRRVSAAPLAGEKGEWLEMVSKHFGYHNISYIDAGLEYI